MRTGLPTRAGGALLINQFGERYLYEVNRETFRRTGADSLFSRHFGTTLTEENRFHIIIGTDSGLLPASIARRDIPRGSRFLFVELPEILGTLEAHGLLPDANDRIRYATEGDWLEIADGLGLTEYLYMDAARVNLSLAAADAYLVEYRLLTKAVQESFDSRMWGIEQALGTFYFFDMMLANLAEDRHPARLLSEGDFQGKTAVLLAGGPSLDTVLPWVKAHREQVVVLAVSRICRRLQEENLLPDIVVSIDPTRLSFDISKELLEFPERVLLVNANHVNPGLLGQWPGRNLYLGQRFPWPTPLNPDNISVGGPTVTNSALMLAIEMGFSQIILGGVDLCLSPEGYSHARGSNERRAGPLLGHIGIRVDTNDGRSAETRHDFAHAINAVALQAQVAAQAGCTLINPAPEAARIEGVEYRPFNAIEIKPLDQPAGEILLQCVPPEDSDDRHRDGQVVLEELERCRNELEKIAALAGDAVRYNDLLFSTEGNLKHKKRLDRIEKAMDGTHEQMVTFIKKYALHRLLKLNRPDDAEQWTDAEGAETARSYYTTVQDCARELLERIEQSRVRICSRMLEESDFPDLESLATQWRQDQQPGRARVWRHRHPQTASALSGSQLTLLDALVDDYRKELEEHNTGHAQKIGKEAELGPVRSKALLLFQQADREGLSQLAQRLADTPQEGAIPYRMLVRGYLAELENDTDAALEAYQAIENGPLLEESLKRIAHLSLDRLDLDNAALALECLGHISPNYLAQYADVLRLNNQFQQAAEAYTQYLDNAPDDLATVIKLGQLHQDAGNTEVALQIFDYVLERDPANLAARQLRDNMERTA